LSTDLSRLCAASGVGARINADSLPMSSLTNAKDAQRLAMHGGDDYELLFCVRKKDLIRVPGRFQGLRLTQIGEITKEKKLLVRMKDKTVLLESEGWDPFREE
jgi:thiamine-monophosphate kinase